MSFLSFFAFVYELIIITVFGSILTRLKMSTTDIPILSMQVKVAESARDLGVVLDNQLSLSSHVAALCRAGFFHVRQLRKAIQSVTTAAARTAVQSFICCRLDYCNSFCTVCQTAFFGRSSRSRTPTHVWSSGVVDAITSCRSCVNCTGFLFVDESTTRLHVWCTSH